MNESHLSDLLERAADRTPVGPPPLAEMLARPGQVRRRRAGWSLAAAAAVAVVAVGVTALLADRPGTVVPDVGVPTPSPSLSPTAPTPPAEAHASLEGSWQVVALRGRAGESLIPEPYAGQVRLSFHEGHVNGATGCNDVFGTYVQHGTDLRFRSATMGSTLVGCADEPPLVRRLLEVRHVSGSGSTRYLRAADGPVIAALRPLGARGDQRAVVSGREYALAVALARREVHRADAVLTSATVVGKRGRVTTQSNYGEPCISGHLLVVTLNGTFPHTTTTGLSNGGDTTVRAVVVTADARSGLPCLMGVRTVARPPGPGAVPLDLG